MFLLELGNNSVKAMEKIMEQDAAGLAVDLMSIASLPVLLQVTRILHYLRVNNTHISTWSLQMPTGACDLLSECKLVK